MNNSKLWILTKYFVSIDFFAILSIKQNLLSKKGKKSAAFQGIIGLLTTFILIIFVAPVLGKNISSFILNTHTIPLFTTIFSMIFVVTLFIALSSAFSFIEKTEESEFLLSLPISGKDIISARIYALTIVFFISLQTIILAVLYSLGYNLSRGFDYYIFITISMILFNIESIVLSGIIVLIFGKLIRKSKFFNKFAKAIYTLFMILGFSLYMIITQSFSSPRLGAEVTSVMSNVNEILSKIFFFAVWPKDIIIFKDYQTVLMSLLIGVVSTILIVLIFRILANRNYLEILRSSNVASQEDSSVIEKRKSRGLAYSKQSKFMVLFKREFIEILTTPTYVLQLIVQNVMLIVAFGIIFFKAKDMVESAFFWVITSTTSFELLVYAFTTGAILGIVLGFTSLTTSSVSRDGKAFWIVASAPIKVHTQILARIFACQFLYFIFLMIIILLSLIVHIFDPLVYIALILGASITLFTSGSLNMILGLVNPNFDWKTPKEALNSGSGISFVSILINYGIYVFLGTIFYFGKKNNIRIPIVLLVDILIILLIGIISYIINYKLYQKLLKRL